LCWTTSGCETTCAGLCSTVETARSRPPSDLTIRRRERHGPAVVRTSSVRWTDRVRVSFEDAARSEHPRGV
jgi:hypothetical protein